ncbi:MAG TPA: hypothetical protein VG324_18460, partial [Blastocatellia bacterium]|nr:hypothetical protein [Blastocatellia bacterium]
MKPPKAQELIKEIEAHLPLPVYPTPELAQLLRQKGLDARIDEALQVTSVLDSGEMGGITCAIESKNDKSVFMISLPLPHSGQNRPTKRAAQKDRKVPRAFVIQME